jgi:hypothetical protein
LEIGQLEFGLTISAHTSNYIRPGVYYQAQQDGRYGNGAMESRTMEGDRNVRRESSRIENGGIGHFSHGYIA